MNKLLVLIAASVFIWGCSSSFDTTNLAPEERFAYAQRLYDNRDYEDAVNELQALILQYPGNAIIDDAQNLLGMTRFQRKEYLLAAFEFSKLIRNMVASEYIPDAQFMLGECYYQLSPDFSLDQRYTKKAIEELQAFIDFFPTHPRVVDAEIKITEMTDKLARKELNAAVIYEKMEYYTAAIMYYTNVVEMFHDTRHAPVAMYNKIRLLIERNRNTEALAEITRFLARYPDDTNAGRVESLKLSLENKLSAAKN